MDWRKVSIILSAKLAWFIRLCCNTKGNCFVEITDGVRVESHGFKPWLSTKNKLFLKLSWTMLSTMQTRTWKNIFRKRGLGCSGWCFVQSQSGNSEQGRWWKQRWQKDDKEGGDEDKFDVEGKDDDTVEEGDNREDETPARKHRILSSSSRTTECRRPGWPAMHPEEETPAEKVSRRE